MTDSSAAFEARIVSAAQWLRQMVESPGVAFDKQLRGRLPEKHGVYRIFSAAQPSITLRAGRTKSARDGLRQRIYQNHFMGNQQGNLRQQLVNGGQCRDLEAAKEFIRDNCHVQFLVIDDPEERKWAEYFMLSVLRPIYSD